MLKSLYGRKFFGALRATLCGWKKAGRRAQQARKRSRRSRLTPEVLEDRTAPATITTVVGAAVLDASGGVAADSQGDLFIADTDRQVILEVNLTTDATTIVAGNGKYGYSGDGGPATSAELGYPEGVAVDSQGDLFIADTGNDVIREVSATTHLITTVAGNGVFGYSGDSGPATSAELGSPEGVAADSQGDLFIADTYNHVIREVNATTHRITTVAGTGNYGYSGDSGPAASAALSYPEGVAVDGQGDLFIADTNNHVIREVNATTHRITTVAGNGDSGYSGDGGSATSAALSDPFGVAVDSQGDLFIADSGNDVVREVNGTTGIITTVAGNGAPGYSGDGGPATSAELRYPAGVAVDSQGDIFIADTGNNVIRGVFPSGGAAPTVPSGTIPAAAGYEEPTFTWTGVPTASSYDLDVYDTITNQLVFNGNVGNVTSFPFSSAQALTPGDSYTWSVLTIDANGGITISSPQTFTLAPLTPINITTVVGSDGSLDIPRGVAVDSQGDLFIADTYHQVVLEVNLTTDVTTTVAGNGVYGSSGDGGLATSAELSDPENVAVDSQGDLFIADTGNDVIREVNATTGIITTVAGNGVQGYSGDTGPAASAELSTPEDVAVDSQGDLFIADSGNDVVREVNGTTGIITTVAGNGAQGYRGDAGPASSAELSDPYGVAVDSQGDLFIADTGNDVIREVNATTDLITTVAGNGVFGYSGDSGPAASAKLSHPYGVAVDNQGDLFIADTANTVIREVNGATGLITTVAGNGAPGYSGDTGPATSAELSHPYGVAVNRQGDLFIADTGNSVIRGVVPLGGAAPIAPGGPIAAAAGYQEPTFTWTGVPTAASYDLDVYDTTANRRVFNSDVGNVTSYQFSTAQALTPGDGYTWSVVTVYASGLITISSPQTFTLAPPPPPPPLIPSNITTVVGPGEFAYSQSVAVNSQGDLFIADTFNHVIREVNLTTDVTTIVAGNGVYGYSGDGGSATSAELGYPEAVAVDSQGDLFIADTDNQVIREVNGATGIITTVAGNGAYGGFSGDSEYSGPATSAELSYPEGVAVDSQGDLFIADTDNHVIREVNGTTGIISTVAGNGNYDYSGDGGPATSAELSYPDGVAVDSQGDIFIADTGNNVIREVNGATGIITTVAGNSAQGHSGDNGPAGSVGLRYPEGVAVDSQGDLFIADSGNDVILKVNLTTDVATIVAGNGVYGYSGDTGPATSAELSNPDSVAVDSQGDLFIADSGNGVIRGVFPVGGAMPQAPGGTIPAAAGYEEPTFTWTGVPTASSYDLDVYDTTTNQLVFNGAVGNGASFHFSKAQALTPGSSYSWSVLTFDASGGITISGPQAFMLDPLSPSTQISPSNITIPAAAGYEEPTFTWTKVPLAASYQLYVYDATGYQLIFYVNVGNTTSFAVGVQNALTPGHGFFWEIGTVGDNGAAAGITWSNLVYFLLAPLPASTPISPGNNSTIPEASGYEEPTFTWTNVPLAADYELYVYDTTKNQVVINVILGNASSYLGNLLGVSLAVNGGDVSSYPLATAQALTPGDSFFWEIGTVGDNGNPAGITWSSLVDFTLAPLLVTVPVVSQTPLPLGMSEAEPQVFTSVPLPFLAVLSAQPATTGSSGQGAVSVATGQAAGSFDPSPPRLGNQPDRLDLPTERDILAGMDVGSSLLTRSRPLANLVPQRQDTVAAIVALTPGDVEEAGRTPGAAKASPTTIDMRRFLISPIENTLLGPPESETPAFDLGRVDPDAIDAVFSLGGMEKEVQPGQVGGNPALRSGQGWETVWLAALCLGIALASSAVAEDRPRRQDHSFRP